MSLKDMVEKPQKRAIVATILGDAGVGKSTFASTFPSPVFIRAEDGLTSIKTDALPVLSKVDDLWNQLKLLIHEDHEYKTVIIDSVTKLESMFVDYVIESDPKNPKSINTALGGYGAGFSAVAAMHSRVRKAAAILTSKNINVIFIAHTDTVTIELPDVEPYMRYDLRINKKSVSYYVDDVDLVGFIKLETFTRESEGSKRAKAMSDGTRVLVTYSTAANVSKNRFGIKEDLYLKENENPLLEIIPALSKL